MNWIYKREIQNGNIKGNIQANIKRHQWQDQRGQRNQRNQPDQRRLLQSMQGNIKGNVKCNIKKISKIQ